MKTLERGIALLALAGSGLVASQAAAQEAALSERQAKKLLEELFTLDWKRAPAERRFDEIVEQLAAFPIADARAAKSWRKEVEKLAAKRPKLEKDSGRHFLWEEEERGLYIVGGEEKRPEALFIGMHGGGAGSGDAWSSHGEFNPATSKAGWVAIYPEVLQKVERGWTDSGTEEFVIELVERALRTWKLPRDKVFFGGHSMGGFGSWVLGGHHADLVAGLLPSAGAPGQIIGTSGEVEDVEPGVIPNLRNVALVIYQSDDDAQVPPVANRTAVKKLGEAKERYGGYDYEYWEESGRGHAPPPGGMKALIEKIAGKARDPRPAKVCWQPTLLWKRQFYWLWWRRPTANVVVVAELDRAANAVRVQSEANEGLYVLLDGELLDLDREVTITVNGETVFTGRVQRDLGTLALTAVRGDPALTFEARVPAWR